LILSECILAVCLTTSGASQEPTPQPKQAESGKNKQTGRKPKEEEEDTAKPARKVPLRVGDEDLDTNPPASGKPSTVPTTDLEREAKQAKHPAVQQLFSTLAKPHDVITMVQSLHVWHVEPIAEYVNPKAGPEQKLTLHRLDPSGNARQSFSASSKEILSFEPYEQLALKKVDEFLKSGLQQDTTSKRYLSRLEMFQEAEKALGAVLLFHDSAVERGLRKGGAWNESRHQLVAKLQEVQLNQLEALIDLKNWEGALDLGIRLAETYPAQKNFQDRIIRLLARSAREPLKNKQYPLTRKWLLVLEAQFPGSAELKPIRTKLQEEAQNYLNQAKALDSKKQTQAALEKLNLAKDIDPELAGLRDFELRLTQANPVLYVGVHDLPENLSPATAYLDSEKQAVELLFESLLAPTYSPKLGQCYRPSLAADLPKMVSLGRQFTLARGACWSNGLPVTATDVRSTVGLLCDSKSRGYIPEWAEFLKGGAQIGADSFHISLTLHQGYLDPLSLMDFKVLPDRVSRVDDPDFARNPIGSGPYKLEKRESGRVIFVANPFYERRPGKAGLPRIREMHFFRSENPINDFHEGHLQLLLDLPTSRLKDLENSAGLQDVTFRTLPNRRIYFLAVNHRRPPLDNEPLRRALAHAINRETILNECFRAGRTPPPHQPLNGPYPCQSWAYNRELARDPYSLDLAKAQAKKAKEGLPALRKLSLKYPKGDPDVERACQMIRSEVQQLGAGIDLDLMALEPRALQRDVEEMNEYDLAYYSWEYPDETYWLWPLFDPQATNRGGRNFLGYQNDDRLQRLFREAMSHRDPAEVKRLTHKIHATFADKMPFIPLWQLDTHLAIHNSLSMVDGQRQSVDPDPLRIFTNVETWVLGKR
ncbi:MAG TPA: ABC transporter substrate-binding protein, partial [Gemmataceae bacterium]|nr:ABC transporter substrate-binding protein [Gemmataceae bacterium]